MAPDYVYVVESTCLDTDGKFGGGEEEEEHGAFESLEDANEEAMRVIREKYDSPYRKDNYIARWLKNGTIAYEDGCLCMEDYPDWEDSDEWPIKVTVTKQPVTVTRDYQPKEEDEEEEENDQAETTCDEAPVASKKRELENPSDLPPAKRAFTEPVKNSDGSTITARDVSLYEFSTTWDLPPASELPLQKRNGKLFLTRNAAIRTFFKEVLDEELPLNIGVPEHEKEKDIELNAEKLMARHAHGTFSLDRPGELLRFDTVVKEGDNKDTHVSTSHWISKVQRTVVVKPKNGQLEYAILSTEGNVEIEDWSGNLTALGFDTDALLRHEEARNSAAGKSMECPVVI
ncbi:hypothetical protein BJ508DRAFT_410397, partial [Ascobolus immersus RN42]